VNSCAYPIDLLKNKGISEPLIALPHGRAKDRRRKVNSAAQADARKLAALGQKTG
jgi:hypothetical protein